MRIFTLLLAGFLFMTATNAHAMGKGPDTEDTTPAVPSTPSSGQQPEQAPAEESLPPLPADATGRLFKLSNGLTVLLKKDNRFPLVSVRLFVHAGSVYETEAESGISHVLEHMVFKGTDKRPKGTVSADVENTGGYLNAATSFDYTVYVMDMPAAEWATSLDVVKDMAFHATLDPDELAAEKDVIVSELKQRDDEPGMRLFNRLQKAAMPNTPYSRAIIGTEETIRSFTPEGIRDYIARLYQPQGMLLVVVGDIDLAAVEKEAMRLFGPLQNTKPLLPAPVYEPSPLENGPVITVEEGVWNKVRVGIAFQVPGLRDGRSAQLDVLSQLLGGDATSRFYRKLKYEKRLVDSISTANYSFERIGMFIIQASLDADKLEAFWAAMSEELAGLSDVSFTQEELERAKLNMEDDLFRSKETIEGLTQKLGYFQFFSDGEMAEANYLETIKSTGQNELTDLVKRYISPEAMSSVLIVPKEKAGDLPTGDALRAKLLSTWKPAGESAKAESQKAHKETETIDLGQDRKLVLVPDVTLPYTAVNLMFRGGDFLLTPETQGLGMFTASLLTKGNKNLTATQLEDFKADRAASFGAAAGKQSFTVSMNFPSRFTDDMFTLLQDTLLSPTMAKEEADRVRDNQIAFIKNREDQPVGLAFRRIFPFLFEKHPYAFLQSGNTQTVQSYTEEDAKTFWQKQSAQPWVMAVCGDFDREAIIEWAKKLPAPSAKAPSITAPTWSKERGTDIHLPGRNQAHLLMLFPTVGTDSDDEAGMDLLQTVLAGQSGLLFRDLRDEQGLGYTVTAFPWKTEKTGALIFYIGTDSNKMELAENGFKKAVEDLHNTLIAENDLARGKNQMLTGYYRGTQSLGSRSSEAAVLSLLGKPLDRERQNIAKAQKLTAADLQNLARKYLVLDRAYFFKVLPEESSKGPEAAK